MKILVTGGAGYIGSILVPELLSKGHSVTVVDNFRYGIPSLAGSCLSNNFSLVRGDIQDISLVRRLVKEADLIVPLAALVGAPLCSTDPFLAERVNKKAIFDMLSLLSADQWVIMPTTNSAYGSGDENNICDESSKLRPLSIYARDKVEVEDGIMARKNSVSMRLATVFGMSPRMRLDLLVNDFTYRAVRDKCLVIFEGHFKRNYIHVRDVARAFLHTIDCFHIMGGEIYNVGLSSANISKLELCSVISKHVPDFFYHEAEVGKDPDQRNYVVSNSKIEATGFTPCVTLDMGIRELIKGYQMIRDMTHRNI